LSYVLRLSTLAKGQILTQYGLAMSKQKLYN